MIIQHAAAAFLQKAFRHGINADKKLDYPKKPYPGLVVGVFNGHIKNKNGSADIEQHAIKSILLPYFEQEVFFEKGK